MKVALVIERMDPSRGGRETSTAQMAEGLAGRGHEVSVICQLARWRCKGVEICDLGCRGRSRIGRLMSFVRDAQETIKRRGWDIVHATLPLPGANVYQPRGGTVPAQVASRFRRLGWRKRTIAALGERFKATRLVSQRMESEIAADPNVLCLAVSELVAEEFEYYYQRKDGVKVIYNGVDVPDACCPERTQWRQHRRAQLGVGPDDLVLLSVANNFALKGVAETIAAFARWDRRARGDHAARLVIAGQAATKADRRLAGKEGVGGQVIFLGQTEAIFQWYAAADACVLLSWYDPCSRVILEAIRWGIPSITTTYNGASEALGDGGVIVDSPKDIEAVVSAMDDLADEQRRRKMARACLGTAGELSMERHVDELLEAYEEALKG